MPGPLQTLATRIAQQNRIPVPLFLALIGRESGWNPAARSPAGALGLGQLMPATARGLGVQNPLNPEQNLEGAARYLAQQLAAFHSPRLALAAYNAGPGAVQRYHGVPPFAETQAYVRNVLGDAGKVGAGAATVPTPTPTPAAALPSPPRAAAGPAQPRLDPGAVRRTLASALMKASQSGNYGGFFQTLASVRQAAPLPLAPAAPYRPPSIPAAPTGAGPPTHPLTASAGQSPQQSRWTSPKPPPLVQVQADSTLTGVDSRLVQAVAALARYLGKPITVTSGYRSYAEQAALYRRYQQGGNIAAKPGQSNHERGEALDLTLGGTPIALAVPPTVLARFGLHNPVRGDYPHTELLSVNR